MTKPRYKIWNGDVEGLKDSHIEADTIVECIFAKWLGFGQWYVDTRAAFFVPWSYQPYGEKLVAYRVLPMSNTHPHQKG